ncbi:MAG: VanW family protein [Patescibacteria group bacterium]
MKVKFLQKLKNTKGAIKWLLVPAAVFFILVGAASATLLYAQDKYQDKIYPGVKISNIDVSGKTKDEASSILNKKITELGKQGIKFKYQDTELSVEPSVSSFGPDVAYTVYSYEVKDTIEKAYKTGRNNDWQTNLITKIKTWRNGKNIPVDYNIEKKKIKELLEEKFSRYIKPAKNASLKAEKTTTGNQDIFEFQIEEGNTGRVLDYDEALRKMESRLAGMEAGEEIKLNSIKQNPEILKEDCAGVVAEAENLMKNSPWKLNYPKEATTTASSSEEEMIDSWEITKDQMASWLTIQKKDGNIRPTLDKEKISSYLEESISPQTDKEPENAKFEIEEEKVVEFRQSKPGKKLNIEKTVSDMLESFIKAKSKKANIFVEKVESEYTNENINDLGVEETLGTGHSNFAGSPANRVHNIYVGAESMNGLLIKPGEEFSTMQALGEVNKNTGYKPELVIKENETTPEYGGGLCQIGTTMFRAALEAGLEITERRNHSYRVSYYEPPVGMDATLYDPSPDLKFKNDTEDHILIQSRIEGTNIYFDLWGTDDGRTVEISEPVVYNITEPKPPEIIETTELEPGVEKCTESAHNGANAEFTYKVDYQDEDKENKERVFYSRYQPWQKKCLIGAEEEDEEKDDEEESNEDKKDPTNTEEEEGEEGEGGGDETEEEEN